MSLLFLFCLLLPSFNYVSSQNYPYDSTCNCTSISSNGNICLQYTCVTIKHVPKCFPGRSIAITENGLMKSLSHLKKGDRVLVMNKDNTLMYEPIEGFIHLKRDGLFDFLLINIKIDDHKNTTTSLFISLNHLIFLADDAELKSAIFASQLHVGDRIKYLHNNQIVAAKIESIYLTKEEGFYAPLTPSGTIIIDNVVVSNYATVSNHQLAHYVMNIYRWWIHLFGSNESNENVHWALQLIERIVKWYGIEKFSQTSTFDGVFQVSGFL
ncbi:unnamed protein product [Rotaria magnacalcarata]|uniref:Uncharacterized protein n=1 Tax=Rotaria magnacalcarata TaxID=392030 RepID=A0A816YDF2_9BILA|nr:unnamed protein product [Rotaria magnacalcarata]CAF1630302.1 unnamed protein product [Rotaria magnacalcarata]CAF2145818.1 unnamed protein product [Rotaria magnacalcarata]CAF2157179.1 unnamed protein product [Rotaria magnacalcarata]CAF3871069.1 unnamed protein product [Rotaria magnacalcarata]